MGTWGYAITEDDTALDAYDDYIELLNADLPPVQIEATLRKTFAEALSDEDDAVSVELGIAKAQWDCGHCSPVTVDRIQKLIDSGAGLAMWEDAGPKAAQKRAKVLAAFLQKLQSTNPRPKRPRRSRVLQPIFVPGDCLAMRHAESGRYAAAIVLFSPIETPKPGQDTYGMNSLGFLDYFSPQLPDAAVFERREWLYVRSHFIECLNEWYIAVDHASALLWKACHSPRPVQKFGKPDVTVVHRTALWPDEAMEETFQVCWHIDWRFCEKYDEFAAAKRGPAIRCHRTEKEMLSHFPQVLDDLRRLKVKSKESRFDLSPLRASKGDPTNQK